jgi:hypothetical protein
VRFGRLAAALAASTLAMVMACGSFGTADGAAPSPNGASPDLDPDANAESGAPPPQIPGLDGAAPVSTDCDAALYCESFAARATVEDVVADHPGARIVYNGASHSLVGDLGTPQRALRVAGPPATGPELLDGQLLFPLATAPLPAAVRAEIVFRVDVASNVDVLALAYASDGAQTHFLYLAVDGLELSLHDFRQGEANEAWPVATVLAGETYRLELWSGPAASGGASASVRLNGALLLTTLTKVPLRGASLQLQYGLFSMRTRPASVVVFDDVKLFAE